VTIPIWVKTTNPYRGLTQMTKEFTQQELLAALAYSDLENWQVVVRVGDRFIVGKLSRFSIEKDTGLVTRFSLDGVIVND